MANIINIKLDEPITLWEHPLGEAVEVLMRGGLLVIPTETFYGVAADSANPAALKRLAALKGRPADKPFPLIAASASQVVEIAKTISTTAKLLMKQYWPGPLTLIVEAAPDHPSASVDGGVGVRVSPHPVARALAQLLGRPITATSANLSGQPAVSKVDQLDKTVLEGVDLVLDSGPCPGGLASTVADVRGDAPVILRPGPIDLNIHR